VTRVVVGACALGIATGWNVANTGAIATPLAAAYGVGLATIGLLTTALFLVHLLMQVPGGRASDRFGARRVGLIGLGVIASANLAALVAADVSLAVAMRMLMGVGTGLCFVAGADYVRAQGGSASAQGLYGGSGVAGGGLALAVVPQLDDWLGWRAPWWTAAVVAGAAMLALAVAPADAPRAVHVHDGAPPPGIFRDRRLYRLGVMYAASFGLSVVAGNWIATLLERNGDRSKGAAGAVAALALMLGMVTRPLGGWLLRHRPSWTRSIVAGSIVACAAGALLLSVAEPITLAVVGAVLIGLGAGLPFAPAFLGAAQTRPDAPATAIGFVNGAASLAVVVGSPLLGLSFSLPGEGRTGFLVMAAIWLCALIALPSRRELGVSAAPELQRG
jgi:nitrate/nitrite transporter NarK